VGTYFYDDHQAAPGGIFEAAGDRWVWKRTGYEPMLPSTPIANSVIVDAQSEGHDSLVKTMPAFLCHAPCAVESYNPAAVIASTVSPRAARRYRLPAGSFPIGFGGISVRFAMYGASCFTVRLPPGSINRVEPGNATRLVDGACSGQDDCEFEITQRLFGDPAPHCGKDFRVQWTCPDGRAEELFLPAEAVDRTVKLHCDTVHTP
jgi:hypothetical protein